MIHADKNDAFFLGIVLPSQEFMMMITFKVGLYDAAVVLFCTISAVHLWLGGLPITRLPIGLSRARLGQAGGSAVAPSAVGLGGTWRRSAGAVRSRRRPEPPNLALQRTRPQSSLVARCWSWWPVR